MLSRAQSVQRSIGVAEKKRDKATLFHTVSERAAGKLKNKKEQHPKNVLGALLFLLLQMYLFHTASFSSFNHSPKPPVYQPPSQSFSPLFISVCSLKAHLKHSEVSGDCKPLCLHQLLPSCILLLPVFLLRVVKSAERVGGSLVFQVTRSLQHKVTKNVSRQ